MAYVRKEEATEKRNLIKKMYPAKKGWKFSITVQNYSQLNVAILKAPFQLLEEENIEKGNETINHFHIENKYQGEKLKVLSNIYQIINKGNYNRSDSMTDYYDVGFYINIEIGKWDRKFVIS